MGTPLQPLGLALRAVAFLASVVALGAIVSGAGAAGSDPYTLQAQALFSSSGTDLTLRVGGPVLPASLEKVQVKALRDDDADTHNFFDVPSPEGAATLRLAGPARGERLQVRVHVKDGPQHNLETETTVLRRPDLTVSELRVPDDVVRTRPFDVTAVVSELGGDVGANARVELFDGMSRVAVANATVAPGAATAVGFHIALARPREHTLRAAVTDAVPAEWDVASNSRERAVYVNHYGENGVVATDHPLATQIGVDVLRHGGNAFDAAVAVQFALNVTQPQFSGLGGGSNILVRDGKTGELFAIDARETAPAATTANTYKGVPAAVVRRSGFAVGVPGTLRAVEYLLGRWGTKALAELLDPAIRLAEDGFPIGNHLAGEIGRALQGNILLQPETRQIFLRADGTPRALGETLKQPELANTLRLLARDGVATFYDGEIADALVAAQRRATAPEGEGKMTVADLRSYSVDVKRPLSLAYGGYDVYSPRPSTSGGLVVLESLGLFREFLADPRNDGYAWGFGTRNSLHVFIEAMRLAFADRDLWVGDDRYTNVPSAGLLDADYLRARSSLIQRETVMCNPVGPGNPPANVDSAGTGAEEPEGHTTHFSIIDRWGNAVVMTSTLRDAFGTGITVPGYGFLLNDSLGLFNASPLANAATGNPGANDAAAGKRPRGNVAPVLILKDGEPYAGTGTFGSGFIPSVVLNVVLNLLEYDMPLQQAVDAPRLWIQGSLGAAQLNFGLDHLITPLRDMGHVASMFGGCADNMNRTPLPLLNNVGSTGSFGVDLETFDLLGAADTARFPDAAVAVVERS